MPKSWKLPGALQEARLRQEPKQVFILGEDQPDGSKPSLLIHSDILGLSRSDPQLFARIGQAARRLITTIENGDPIPDHHYRRSTRFDGLLKGPLCVMHLHVLHPGDDFLLYLVQFKGAVLLVELGTHVHMEGLPPGKTFNVLQMKKLAKRIAEAIPPDPEGVADKDDESAD